MFSPRTQSARFVLYPSSVVHLWLPTRSPRALSAKGHSTLAPVPLSPFVAILDAASSISPLLPLLQKTAGVGVTSLNPNGGAIFEFPFGIFTAAVRFQVQAQRLDPHAENQSRKTRAGSVCVARHAGKVHAASEAMVITTNAEPKASGSRGLTL
jgi:hypothetical protein